MSPAVETGVLIAATIVVGITLVLIPAPRQKPNEFDAPPPVVAPPPPPTPQEVVTATSPITAPALLSDLSDRDRVAIIEQRIVHITQQVKQMEKKVK
jgi:hypothetical protein